MELPPNAQEQGRLFCEQQGLFSRAGLPVPQIYHYEEERGVIFLEDCGDVMLQDLVERQGVNTCYEHYHRAIDWLLQLQAATFTIQGNYPAFGWAFDVPKFTYELEFFLTHMLEGLGEQTIPSSHRRQFSRCFQQLAEVLAREPRYLTHRDYHSRNLMVVGKDIKILDFQDTRLGLCQYDLASLLRDSYVYLPEKLVADLLTYYLSRRKCWKLPALEEKHFQRIFILTCIQRNLKALGTFAYQAAECRNPSYLPYIPPTLRYLRLNLSLSPESADLGRLLGRYLPELKV